MAVNKPSNHAIKEMVGRLSREQTQSDSTPVPEVDLTLLEFLEELYPPRCYTGTGETLEAHLKYAGAVELVQMLRGSYEEQVSGAEADMNDLIAAMEPEDGDDQ